MQVSINFLRQQLLVGRYNSAANQIDDSLTNLEPLLASAYELLGRAPAPGSSPAALLAQTSDDLTKDRLDLQRRGEFLIEADANLAIRIAKQAGDLVNVHLVQLALAKGWTYDETLMRQELDGLRALPPTEQIRREADIRARRDDAQIFDAPHTWTGTYGDLDADFDEVRIGHPLNITSQSPVQRGKDLIIRALDDTADQDTLLRDEFEVILHENGNVTIVLPGVIDLSSPHLGLDEETNSLRDIDQEGFSSATSTSVEDNNYAVRIREWVQQMVQDGVIEVGAETIIVGHSFGGDTALDLAADPTLNGVLVNVTHVYSAAYHNERQFSDVPEHTSVVVAQNIFDIPVFGEEIFGNTNAILEGEPEDMSHGIPTMAQVAGVAAEPVVNAMSWLVNESINEIEESVDEVHDIQFDVPDIPKVDIGDQYFDVADNILLVQFEGGLEGLGHHQNNYTEHLRNSSNPVLDEFLTELDDAGFTEDGTTISIDVTDPNA